MLRDVAKGRAAAEVHGLSASCHAARGLDLRVGTWYSSAVVASASSPCSRAAATRAASIVFATDSAAAAAPPAASSAALQMHWQDTSFRGVRHAWGGLPGIHTCRDPVLPGTHFSPICDSVHA